MHPIYDREGFVEGYTSPESDEASWESELLGLPYYYFEPDEITYHPLEEQE